MKHEELRERAATLAHRAIGGADIDKLLPARDALFAAIVDALRAFNPHRELVDVRELQRQLDALCGAGVDHTRRFRVVQNALKWITALLDRIDTQRDMSVTRPNFARAWHER